MRKDKTKKEDGVQKKKKEKRIKKQTKKRTKHQLHRIKNMFCF